MCRQSLRRRILPIWNDLFLVLPAFCKPRFLKHPDGREILFIGFCEERDDPFLLEVSFTDKEPLPWLLQPRSEALKADFSARVCYKMSPKLVASILVAECTTLDVSIDSTGPDLTTFTSGEQTACVRTASVAIRDFVRGQVHAVLFRTESGDGNSQGLSFRVIGFESGQMDWTTLTVQTAICNHLIHLRLIGRRAWRPPPFSAVTK